jgi:hypothetical protein
MYPAILRLRQIEFILTYRLLPLPPPTTDEVPRCWKDDSVYQGAGMLSGNRYWLLKMLLPSAEKL